MERLVIQSQAFDITFVQTIPHESNLAMLTLRTFF
jgi:hypothetical protein